MEKGFNLLKSQKKAQAGMTKAIYGLIGIVIVILIATALAPTIFENTAALEADVNTPAWVSAILVVLAGVGLVIVFLKVIDK